MNRIRLNTPAAVEQMASANHATLRRGMSFASVTLAGDVYFWAA